MQSCDLIVIKNGKKLKVSPKTIDGKNYVLSVNNQIADSNGNVTLDVISTPGNVPLDVISTPGNIIKWESDFFDIASNETYSFDLTGTVFENEERSDINFQLVAKVKNGNDILQAGDVVFTNYNDYIGSLNYHEIGSYSYIRDKTFYIHFGNDERFVITSSDVNSQTQIPKTDVQCKIILTKIITGSNGELGATPKSVTNIVGVTDNRNLGEVFYSALPIESSQVHLLDGSVLTDVKELYDYLESIKETNPDLFTADENFDSEVESTGKCSKFVLNSENSSVRIPKGESDNYIVIKSFERTFELNQPFSLLEPKWSDVPLNNPSWLLSNGQVNSEENYPSVYQLLLNEYSNGELKTESVEGTTIQYKQLENGHKVVTDKTAYDSILVNTGTAWYYLLDLESKTFALPQTNGLMKFGNSNQVIKESLPNAVQGYLYFYVGEFVGTANSIDFSNLGSLKDNIDLEVGNIKNSMSTLKTDISSYAFPGPKYDMLTIPTSKTTLVAPENGWFVYQSHGSGTAIDYIFLRNNTNLMFGSQTRDARGKGLYTNIPVKKGEEVYFEYTDSGTTKTLKFIYASDKCE